MGGVELLLMRQKLPGQSNLYQILHFYFLKTLLLTLAQTHTTSKTKSQLRRAQRIEGVDLVLMRQKLPGEKNKFCTSLSQQTSAPPCPNSHNKRNQVTAQERAADIGSGDCC